MHSAASKLKALLQQNPFLQQVSSRELYPDAPGQGLPLLRVQTPICSAVISLQGAQLLEFKTVTGFPLLWLSPNCKFTPGTALRGGIPLCLPWFGPHRTDVRKPKHGFARNNLWELCDAKISSADECDLTFAFSSAANDVFAYDFHAELRMTLGRSVKLELTVTNSDSRDFNCSWALHSYHPVASLADVRVKGLTGRIYLDNLENHTPKLQTEDVKFTGEVDRAYPAIENSLIIVGQPGIEITHHNCPSVIVWNPGAKNAAAIADIGAGQEQGYICVERGAILGEEWNLTAGESKTAWLEIKEI